MSARDAIAWGCSAARRCAAPAWTWTCGAPTPTPSTTACDFEVPSSARATCLARYLVRIEEMRQSMRIIEQASTMLPAGPGAWPRCRASFKPPAGEAHGRVESPRGDLSIYLVSDGCAKPCRLRIHSPSFGNLQALPADGARPEDRRPGRHHRQH